MEYIAAFDDKLELSLIYEDENMLEVVLDENINPDDDFSIGTAPSALFEVSLIDVDEGIIFEQETIKPYIGLVLDGTIEYVPLGVFIVDDIKKEKRTIKLTCFDNMIKLEKPYFSELTYPAPLNAVVQEICQKAGVVLANTSLPNTSIGNLSGYTLREAIGFIAAFMGGFARINRDGKLEINSYTDSGVTITADNYASLYTAERTYSIGKLTCYVGEDEEGNMQILTAGTTGHEVVFECPIMTQGQLNNIYATLSQLSYMPYRMEWQGNPALMAGDKITVIDAKDNVYSTLLMRQKITYRGGLKATAEAVGKTKTAQATRTIGTLTKNLDRKTQIARTAAMQYADQLADAIVNGQYSGTFIDRTTIYSPIIAGTVGRFTGEIKVGIGNDLAGISGMGTTGSSIRFWAGHADKTQAPFRVTQDGRLIAMQGQFAGTVLGISGEFERLWAGNVQGAHVEIGEDTGDPFFDMYGVKDGETKLVARIDKTGIRVLSEEAAREDRAAFRVINQWQEHEEKAWYSETNIFPNAIRGRGYDSNMVVQSGFELAGNGLYMYWIGGFSPFFDFSIKADTQNVTPNIIMDSGQGGDIVIKPSVQIGGNLRPITDNAVDIGTSSHRFRDLWLGRNAYIAGNVGIGTTSPAEKLHVNGSVLIPVNEAYKITYPTGVVGNAVTPTTSSGRQYLQIRAGTTLVNGAGINVYHKDDTGSWAHGIAFSAGNDWRFVLYPDGLARFYNDVQVDNIFFAGDGGNAFRLSGTADFAHLAAMGSRELRLRTGGSPTSIGTVALSIDTSQNTRVWGNLRYDGGLFQGTTRGVPTADIQDSAVTEAKIASGAVTRAKIAANAVNYTKTSGVSGEYRFYDHLAGGYVRLVFNNGLLTSVS